MEDKKRSTKSVPLINDRIRARQIQLITHEGENLGVVSREDALRLALEAGFDLVVIADHGPTIPPVAKIMDFGKVEYEKKKKFAVAKKKQKFVKVKEIKFRPKIGEHDFQTKIKQAVQFLQSGKHLKATLMFRGRERSMINTLGKELFEKIDQAFEQHQLNNLVKEKDMNAGAFLSRVYYLKG